MKQKFFYIIFSVVILTTSSGFGFLESSTIMHGREIRQIKEDSIRMASQNNYLANNSLVLRKEPEKPANQFTKSFIQWVANALKNTVQVIVNTLIEMAKAILVIIVKFIFG
jgi:hypothetical protein